MALRQVLVLACPVLPHGCCSLLSRCIHGCAHACLPVGKLQLSDGLCFRPASLLPIPHARAGAARIAVRRRRGLPDSNMTLGVRALLS